MKKAFLASMFSVCLGLLAVSAWLLFSPSAVFAAEGTAKCGSITSVRCADGAVRCVCEDGKGCTSYFADGTWSEAKCKDTGGPATEEGAN